jgi:hypothetical protein
VGRGGGAGGGGGGRVGARVAGGWGGGLTSWPAVQAFPSAHKYISVK